MIIVLFVVFLLVFGVLAFVLNSAAGGGKQAKLTRTTLDSAIKVRAFSRGDEIVDIRKNITLSSMPWLNEAMAKIRSVTELRLLLDQAELKWTPSGLLLTSAACWLLASYLVHSRTGFGIPSLLLGLIAAAAPVLYVLFKRRRRFAKFVHALPDALDLLVSALRGGHSMISALGIVAAEAPEPIRRELKLCFEEQNFGLDLRTALENLTVRVPVQDLRIVTTAMIIQKESGGNLAEVLDKTAQVIRDRFRIQQQIQVYTAQGRLTGWVLTLLPIGLGVVMSLVNADYMKLLFARHLGHQMMWTALGMNVLGMFIIRKIVRIEV